MKYFIEVLVKGLDKDEWKKVHPSNEKPYEYPSVEKAKYMAEICYSGSCGGIRITNSNNEIEYSYK